MNIFKNKIDTDLSNYITSLNIDDVTISWDFSKNSYEEWHEILYKNNLIFQLDSRFTVNQFNELIDFFDKNPYPDDHHWENPIPITTDDNLFIGITHKKELINEFIKLYLEKIK